MTLESSFAVHCCSCDGQNVKRDAHAVWNEKLQIWELSNTYDDFFCDDCGHEVSVIEKVAA